jgi:hypothetical protein
MKYKLTILNASAFLFLIGCAIYTAINYSVLSGGEGWGIVYMIGLAGFGITAIIVDLVIQSLIKDKKKRLLVSLIVVAIYLLLFFIGAGLPLNKPQ